MAEASLTFDSSGFERAARAVPRLLRTSLKFRFEVIGDEFERRIDDRFTAQLSGEFRRNTTSDKLANRTGSLRRSMRSRIVAQGAGVDGLRLISTIGNTRTSDYAKTQEFGATIKPKRARALTVPMPANLTAAGRVRFKNPRSIEGLFLLKKGKNAFLVRRKPKGDGLEFLFKLEKEVKIPARLGFRETWRSERMRRFRIREMNEGVRKAIQKAGLS